MEPEGLLPLSQVPATCPYPEPAQSSPYPHISLPDDPLYYYASHLRLGFSSGLSPPGFPTKTLYTPLLSPISATCPTHLILLDFITRTIMGEEYRSFSSSLCSFLHSPVTSSLLGPNNLLCTLFSDTLRLQCTLYKNSAFASQKTHSPRQIPYKYRNNQRLLLHSHKHTVWVWWK